MARLNAIQRLQLGPYQRALYDYFGETRYRPWFHRPGMPGYEEQKQETIQSARNDKELEDLRGIYAGYEEEVPPARGTHPVDPYDISPRMATESLAHQRIMAARRHARKSAAPREAVIRTAPIPRITTDPADRPRRNSRPPQAR